MALASCWLLIFSPLWGMHAGLLIRVFSLTEMREGTFALFSLETFWSYMGLCWAKAETLLGRKRPPYDQARFSFNSEHGFC